MQELETVALDWESHWDTKQGYSLKGMSYTEYVRDKRFRAHGVALCRGSESFKARWITHNDVATELAKIDWSNARLVAHNGLFDFLVLAERYGHRPAEYFCTMSAARFWHQGETKVGLDPLAKFHKLGGKLDGFVQTNGVRELPPEMEAQLIPYALDDVRKAVYMWGYYSKRMPEHERQLMSLTFRMFCEPVLEVDLQLVREGFRDALRERIAKIEGTSVPSEILRSRPKFAAALENLGVEVPMKISPTTKKSTYAFAKTDEDFIALLDHEDQEVRDLVEAQMAAKSTIGLTRAMRLFRLGKTGKLAVAYNYARARTHRFSGANSMNLQNFKRGSKLRRAIRAPKGYVLCVSDSANIESRGGAWLAKQEDKLQMFRDGGDPYNVMATAIYGREIDRKRIELDADGNEFEPDFIEGFVGKTAELGLGYGMGPPKFQATCKRGAGGVKVELDLSFCETVVQAYRRKHYMVERFWGMLDSWAHLMASGTSEEFEWEMEPGSKLVLRPAEKRLWFPNGTSMHYPDIQHDDAGGVQYRDLHAWKTLYGGKFMENVDQKISRDVIAHQMLEIDARYPVVMMTHDEIIWVAPEAEADEALAFGVEIMKTPPPWAGTWPLGAKGGYAENYSK